MSNPEDVPVNQQLEVFLLGTINPQSPIRKLRGHKNILRLIWSIACEEWWNLHIGWYEPKHYRYRGMNLGKIGYHLSIKQIRSPDEIPDLSVPEANSFIREWAYPAKADHVYSGVPMVIIGKEMPFPSVSHLPNGSYEGQVDNILNINMMPFDITKPKETLPSWCHGYLPMIQKCVQQVLNLSVVASGYKSRSCTGYLTIDERPVNAGQSQRRGGLHVESPLWSQSSPIDARTREIAPASLHWGGGPIRASRIHGGIFMCSNVAQSTAVWNCQVWGRHGEVVRKHGSLEHCRELLGAPSKLLQAGELVWLTDHTPHESLPVMQGGVRQFFRLVVGEVAVWFVDHNTPNPSGYDVREHDPTVQILIGNKFSLCQPLRTRWECGTNAQIVAAKEWARLRRLLNIFELGHLIEAIQDQQPDIRSVATFLEKAKSRSFDIWHVSNNFTEYTFDRLVGKECDDDMISFMIAEVTNPNPTDQQRIANLLMSSSEKKKNKKNLIDRYYRIVCNCCVVAIVIVVVVIVVIFLFRIWCYSTKNNQNSTLSDDL